MFALFFLHVAFFSMFAIALTILPKPVRATWFYAYLAIILIIGGFLGNAYSLQITDKIVVSGGNLVYSAFMMTATLFALAERDSFILRRIVQLVVTVDFFNVLLSFLVTRTFNSVGTINPHETPAALFQTSIPFIILGGVLIIVELGIMFLAFELIKRLTSSIVLICFSYLFTFVIILCFDGVAFPIIAFGPSPEVLAITIGSLSGKMMTAGAYGLTILTFAALFPKIFAAYLNQGVFTLRTILSTSSDVIQDLKDKDAQLNKSEARILQSAKLARLGYSITSAKTGKVVECDEAYAQMHGMSAKEFIGLDASSDIIGKLLHKDDRQKGMDVRNRVYQGEAVISELRYVMPNGDIRSLRKIFSPLNAPGEDVDLYEVVGQDVTETKQLQDRLFQSQKMDAIGKLTGGVAHDFNNLLAVILGNLELLDDEVTDPEKKELIQNSIDATMRGAGLTRNMLSFARKAPLEPTIVNINDLVSEMETWIGRTLPSSIKVETILLNGLWTCEVDPNSAESGLLNLLLNARDAMPKGGNLVVQTSNVTIGKNHRRPVDFDIEPGKYVLLSVSDTGEGIAPENLEKIFDPFFTTKPVGSGSGLGLSMLDGFMRQSGGRVYVSSEQGIGTTFDLYFAATSLPHQQEILSKAKEMDTKNKQRATVLLVEDNPEVLKMLRLTLLKAGYRVVDALSGDTALETFHREPDIDILLTDIVMPGRLQGKMLADEIRALKPELPVVFISGNSSDTTIKSDDVHSHDVYLTKPVQRSELIIAMQKALSLSQ